MNNNFDYAKSFQLREQLIKPIMSLPFKELVNNEEINDSFELCLLRFMHLVFSNNGIINIENLQKYMNMDKNICIKLNEYFMEYSEVIRDNRYYHSRKGIITRLKWFKLLSNNNFLTYTGINMGISSDINNFIAFFDNFFPKLNINGNTYQEKLTDIYSKLNFNFDSFDVIHSTNEKMIGKLIQKTTMQTIKINGIELFAFDMTKIIDTFESNLIEIFNNSEFRYSI
jgi:hypothetical protein